MKLLITLVITLGLAHFASAEQTTSEKASAKANDAGRSIKNGVHRAEEAACLKDKAHCASQKSSHKAKESSEYIKDKTTEVIDKVD